MENARDPVYGCIPLKKPYTPPSKKIEIDVWDQAKTSSPPLRNFQPANFSPPPQKKYFKTYVGTPRMANLYDDGKREIPEIWKNSSNGIC